MRTPRAYECIWCQLHDVDALVCGLSCHPISLKRKPAL